MKRATAGYDNAAPIDHDETAEVKPDPTFADVPYGPHERNVFDLWLAESDEPTPLVIFFHGGAYKHGDKSIISFEMLDRLLPEGISVASANYRLTKHARLPAAHYDCKRALQFMRYKAEEYNLDKVRIGAYGGSAGAKITMWLAFLPDMADPDSEDPVERESTRLYCAAPASGQASMDMKQWEEWIPNYKDESTEQDLFERYDAETVEEAKKIRDSLTVINFITNGDIPPTYMKYGMNPNDPEPEDPHRARMHRAHHVNFGIVIKEKLDEVGAPEVYLQYPGVETPYPRIPDFFIDKLRVGPQPGPR